MSKSSHSGKTSQEDVLHVLHDLATALASDQRVSHTVAVAAERLKQAIADHVGIATTDGASIGDKGGA